ncbi:hypothetical protein D3C87_1102250 [compost metagenome]
MTTDLSAVASIWQECSDRPLTQGDAQEIVGNLAGFFRVLDEWSQQDILAAAMKHADGYGL